MGNAPPIMPEGAQEPNESQQGNQSGDQPLNSHLPNDPRFRFHKPSQQQMPKTARKSTPANFYTTTTEAGLSNLDIWKKNQPKSNSAQEASTRRPSAIQKPGSSRAQSEFGAGKQGGFIQGQEPFFTLHRTGNVSGAPGEAVVW